MIEVPIFQSIFGTVWDDLPPVMKKHYANRPHSDDVVTVEGTLDVFCGGWIKRLAPIFALMRSIPPWNEKSVPVTVHFRSDKHTRRFHFERVFRFTGRKPYHFRSYMVQITGNDVAEITGAAMGWRMRYGWEGGKVVMRHNGYVLRLFGHYIPVPLELLIGEGYAEETPMDGDTFDMVMHLTHSKWGKIYEYRGRFGISAIVIDNQLKLENRTK